MPHRIVHNHTLVHSPDCSLNSGLNFKLRTDVYSTYLLNSTLCNEDNTSCWSLRFVLKSISRPILILNFWFRSEDHTSALTPKSIPGIEDHSFLRPHSETNFSIRTDVHTPDWNPLEWSSHPVLMSTQAQNWNPHFRLKCTLWIAIQYPDWCRHSGPKTTFFTEFTTPYRSPQCTLHLTWSPYFGLNFTFQAKNHCFQLTKMGILATIYFSVHLVQKNSLSSLARFTLAVSTRGEEP